MTNKQLIASLFSLSLIFLTAHAAAQSFVCPEKIDVRFGQNSTPEFRKAAHDFYTTAHGLREIYWVGEDPKASPEEADRARDAKAEKFWPDIKKTINSKKPFVIAEMVYFSEAEQYYGTVDNIALRFVDEFSPYVSWIAMFGPDRTECEDWTCTSSGYHREQQTDYFAWDEESKQVYWRGSIKHYSGCGACDDEARIEFDAREKLTLDMFKRAIDTPTDIEKTKAESSRKPPKSTTKKSKKIQFGEDTPPEFRKSVRKLYGQATALRKLSKKADRSVEKNSFTRKDRSAWVDFPETITKPWKLISDIIHPEKPMIVAKTWHTFEKDEHDFSTHHIDVLYRDEQFILQMVMRPAESRHCEKWTCTSQFKSDARADYFAWDEKYQKVVWIGSIKFLTPSAKKADPNAELTDALVRDMWEMSIKSQYGEDALK